jgi:catechol 2,3-dioxygenase-like lactoylglutathione lyase family enzyme
MAPAGRRIGTLNPALAVGLDHVGIVVRDLARASAAWAALGFAPVGGRIMLGQGYLELLADDPARPSATLARFLAQGEGAHVLSLRVASAEAAAARLARAGLDAELLAADRAADPDRPDGPRARFLRLPLTDADPRLQLIEQQTPELVWQQRFLAHPNGATALTGVTLTAASPAAMAARLSRVAGRPVAPQANGYRLALPQGRIDILPGDGPPRITRVTLRAPTSRTMSLPGLTVALLSEG